jgi:hypothetical protein
VSRKACGANPGDGGNKGKEHIVVVAARGASSGGCREELSVGQICWATVVTNKGKEHIVVGAASGSSGGSHKGLVEQIWATVVTKARITVGAASCTAQTH